MNTLEQKLQSDLTDAIKSRDTVRMNTIKGIKTAIMEVKTAKNGKKDLEDSDIVKIIQKLAKTRKETGELYQNNNRQDLADIEFGELSVLETYLPKMLTEDEIKVIVDNTISELGVSDIKGMGRVIGTINKTYAGQVDGSLVAKIVKEKLS